MVGKPGHRLLLFFGLELNCCLFLGHELAAVRWGLYYHLSCVSSIWSWLIARIS